MRSQELAQRLVDAVSRPFEVDGAVLHVGVSIGLALAQAHDTVDTVMKTSDGALYRAKHEGRGRVVVAALGAAAVVR